MLKLKNIKKNYVTAFGTVEALKGVTLNFRKNEFVSILGPSGCGKTTLLNVVGGLDHYTQGDLVINGVSTKEYKDKDWDSYRNHSIGFVFQSYNLIPHQTVLENVELALTLSGISKSERKKRAKEVLEKVGLADRLNVRPNQLSGGQMQRVAIARALVNNPDILLADEPTGALDTGTSVQILDLLKEIANDKLVIMVTHNPDLANKYSTRIIKLVDGLVISDTAPYEGEVHQKKEVVAEVKTSGTAKKKKDRKNRTSMSFMTALSLSFRNLLTKKTRSILVALAGSIGIIGIATILSLSTGFQLYINKVQEDTLSTYPLTIEETTIDMTSVLENIMNQNQTNEEHDLDKIYTSTVMLEMFRTLMAGRYSNNLRNFKTFLESDESKIKDYVSDIKYSYNIDIQLYSSNLTYGNLAVNPSTLFKDILTASGMDQMSSYADSMPIFSEMLDNQKLLESQYDLVDGKWPTNYDEVVMVIDKNNEINDYILYALGLKDPKDLKDLIAKIVAGEDGQLEKNTYTYQDILNLTFKLVLNTDYYEKSGNIWVDRSTEDLFLSSLINKGTDIKVVGIIRPSADGVAESINGAIGYTSALTRHVIAAINDSQIVKEQKANEGIDVFTGKPFVVQTITIEMVESLVATMGEPFISIYNKEKADLIAEFGEEVAKVKLVNQYKSYLSTDNTYEKNLEKMGVNDLSSPSKISLYPIDFASKNEIISIIKKYNADQISQENENNAIQYTDYIGLLMSSISSVINAITYVLVAFVAISLVVSSIMIGIITYISVLERIKEIGILRSVGASKRDISNVFNAETLIIGLIAGTLGIVVTLLIDIPINIIIKAVAGISNVATLQLSAAAILIGISMVLSLIAGLIPSRMAAKKDPVEALRTE